MPPNQAPQKANTGWGRQLTCVPRARGACNEPDKRRGVTQGVGCTVGKQQAQQETARDPGRTGNHYRIAVQQGWRTLQPEPVQPAGAQRNWCMHRGPGPQDAGAGTVLPHFTWPASSGARWAGMAGRKSRCAAVGLHTGQGSGSENTDGESSAVRRVGYSTCAKGRPVLTSAHLKAPPRSGEAAAEASPLDGRCSRREEQYFRGHGHSETLIAAHICKAWLCPWQPDKVPAVGCRALLACAASHLARRRGLRSGRQHTPQLLGNRRPRGVCTVKLRWTARVGAGSASGRCSRRRADAPPDHWHTDGHRSAALAHLRGPQASQPT